MWFSANPLPGGTGHRAWHGLSTCPGWALTLLQLFLVICFWLGGHDLKQSFENTSQVARIVGLQLIRHA